MLLKRCLRNVTLDGNAYLDAHSVRRSILDYLQSPLRLLHVRLPRGCLVRVHLVVQKSAESTCFLSAR